MDNVSNAGVMSPADKSSLAEKAFAVVETIGTLENALWEIFYLEFLEICEREAEENLQCLKQKNGDETDVSF